MIDILTNNNEETIEEMMNKRYDKLKFVCVGY